MHYTDKKIKEATQIQRDLESVVSSSGKGFGPISNEEYKVENFAGYRWIITRDRISDPDEKSSKGTQGPHNCNFTLKTNPTRFSLYDDDDNCYYEGMLYGDYCGLEPLDDFGEGWAGCTYVKINGKRIN